MYEDSFEENVQSRPSSENSHSESNPVSNEDRCSPSWGTWPGLALLTRKSAHHPVDHSATEPPAKKRGATKKHSSLHYTKKDRIIFYGKPPLPSPYETISDDQTSSTFVLVSNITWWINDCDVRDAAQIYGQIRAVRMLSDISNPAKFLGLALIQYTNKASAMALASTKKPILQHRSEIMTRAILVPQHLIKHMYGSLSIDDLDAWMYGCPLNPNFIRSLCDLAGVSLAPDKYRQTTTKQSDTLEHKQTALIPCVAVASAAALVLENLNRIRATKHDKPGAEYDILEQIAPVPFSNQPLHPLPDVQEYISYPEIPPVKKYSAADIDHNMQYLPYEESHYNEPSAHDYMLYYDPTHMTHDYQTMPYPQDTPYREQHMRYPPNREYRHRPHYR